MNEEQRRRLAILSARITALESLTPEEWAELANLQALSGLGTVLATLSVSEDSTPEGDWTVEGLALPYGEEMERYDVETGATRQVFEANSASVVEGAPLFFGHDHGKQNLLPTVPQMPVGLITEQKQTPEGLWIKALISKTAKGQEVYTLLKDGVLRFFSVGFTKVSNVLEDAGTDAPLLRHQSVEVLETSTVWDPQYRTAAISAVLSRQGPRNTPTPHKEGTTMNEEQRRRLAELRAMTTLNQADAAEMATLSLLEGAGSDPASQQEVQSLAAEVQTLSRQIATIGDGGAGQHQDGPPSCFLEFGSYGHLLQALASTAHDQHNQAMEVLAYVGGVVGDLGDWVKDSWVGDLYRPLEERRRVLNRFQTRPLPATGMGVEFGRLLSDTTQVAKQAAEGDLLAYGKIAFETDRAGLETFGGWGDMSRQEIERSAMAVVEKFFQALLRRYAQTTEAAVQAEAVDTANSTALTGGVLDLATVEGWTRFMVRAAKRLDDNGHSPEFALVSWDVFEDLALLRLGTDGPFLLDRNTGNVNITGLSGEVYNVPIQPITAAADTVRVCDSSALATFEASGAPFRLQDDDITHLTKAFSVYGYMAIADEDHGAIVRPQTA